MSTPPRRPGVTDGFFRTPGLALAEARAKDDVPLRLYQFDWATPSAEGRFGATHCLDLPFTFHNAERWSHAPFPAGADPEEVEALGTAMHRAWIAFVRTGNPDHPGIPHWRPYDEDTCAVLRFDTAITSSAPFSLEEQSTDGEDRLR
ncbi:carboxylesterase family protein [Streptodolium elevatio]